MLPTAPAAGRPADPGCTRSVSGCLSTHVREGRDALLRGTAAAGRALDSCPRLALCSPQSLVRGCSDSGGAHHPRIPRNGDAHGARQVHGQRGRRAHGRARHHAPPVGAPVRPPDAGALRVGLPAVRRRRPHRHPRHEGPRRRRRAGIARGGDGQGARPSARGSPPGRRPPRRSGRRPGGARRRPGRPRAQRGARAPHGRGGRPRAPRTGDGRPRRAVARRQDRDHHRTLRIQLRQRALARPARARRNPARRTGRDRRLCAPRPARARGADPRGAVAAPRLPGRSRTSRRWRARSSRSR